MRHAHATDANHADIRDGLRALGFWVWDVSNTGNGFPDLLVAYRKRFILLEVKDGTKALSRRKLTPLEEAFHRNCPGPVYVVHTLDEALDVVRGKGVARHERP